MSLYRNQYEHPGDHTYNSIKPVSGIHQERNSVRNVDLRPGSYSQQNSNLENYRQANLSSKRNGITKLNQVRRRVHEVIDLCKGENVDVKADFGQVIGQQHKIYNMLMQNPNIIQRTLSQPSFPLTQAGQKMQAVPYRQSQKRQQITTPYRPQKTQYVPQSQYYIPNFSQIGVNENNFAPNISHSNVLRLQSGYLQPNDQINMPFVNLGAGFDKNQAEDLQNNLHKIKNSKQINLSEDALRLIEQIERKAFEQIQKLRKQKLQLMQRLNQQIRRVNQQKLKNSQLQTLLARSPQRPDGSPFGYGAGQNTQAHIIRLENQLRRVNEINNNLRMELNQRGSGVTGIEQLLRQGQAIRQETLRLLKLKEQGQSNQSIQELQRRLAAEQNQKKNALNEVKALKQRLAQGNYDKSYQPQVSDMKSASKVRPPTNVKGVGHYEDMVSEMKRITGF